MTTLPNPENGGERPPKKSLTGWVLLLPLALLIGLLWQSRPAFEPESPSPGINPRIRRSVHGTPVARATATPAAKTEIAIYVPGGDELLHRQTVALALDAPPTDAKSYGVAATMAVNALLAKAPQSFPRGTRLAGPVRLDADGNAVIDMNTSFQDPNFWSSEKQTELTIEALVQTVQLKTAKTSDYPVQLLIGGKKIDVLGQMDAGEPFTPRKELVARP